MAGESGTPTQGNAGSNVFAVPTQMQNQQVGPLLSTTPQTPTTQTTTPTPVTPSTISFNPQQQTSDISNMLAGGKDGGNMRPQKTAMGTPIIYGNTYLPQSSMVVNKPIVTDTSGSGGGIDAGGLANGTMSVPGYAYGTSSVAGYAQGTMGADDDDPWNWTKKEQMAPLAANIKPSEASVPQAVPDETEKYLGQVFTGMATNAAAKGINTAYKAYGTVPAATTAAPVATAAPLSAVAPVATAAPLSAVAPVATTAAVAPVVATTAGAVAPVAGTALTTTAGGAAALGGEAMLAAMGPVGMVIGGALLAKKLGIF